MNNLLKRTISGLIFTAIFVFGVIWDRNIYTLLFLLILYFCQSEFYKLCLGGEFKLQQQIGLLTGALTFLLLAAHCFYGIDARYVSLAFVPLLLLPASCLLLPSRDDFSSLGVIYTGLLYIALPVALSPLIMMDGDVFSGWHLLSFFILIWFSDVGAYCFGTLFGQKEGSKKMAPSISPKKSWVGFWGGLVMSIAGAVGLHFLWWYQIGLGHCIVIGLIIALGGVTGDLFESMWKRHYGVKDSGKIIPGHGGMLDRFDSALVAVPLAVIYLTLFGLL